MIPVEQTHLVAVLNASAVCCDLVEFFPENDVVMEMRQLVFLQNKILISMMRQRHFGSDALEDYLLYIQDLVEMTKRLRKCH